MQFSNRKYCNIIVSVPFIYTGNFPPYVNFINCTGRMSRFFATYEQRQTSFQFQFQFQMQTLFQHYSLQPKPELPLDCF